MMTSLFRALLPLLLLSVAIGGCSTDPDPATDLNAFTLHGTGTRQGNVAFFKMTVTKDQKGVRGAKLVKRTSPSTTIDTIAVRSDSTGLFDFAMVLSDSISRYAFYAVKDTMVSNTLLWP